MTSPSSFVAITAALGAACARTGGEAGLDVIPASHDVRLGDVAPRKEGDLGYSYVARRPLAVVGLAEARGIEREVARQAVDRVADALDACATEEGRRGLLAEGAARVVAQVDPDGSIGATSVHIDPGSGVAQNAVRCLVVPVRLLVFPAADSGARGVAIEAMWGRVVPQQ